MFDCTRYFCLTPSCVPFLSRSWSEVHLHARKKIQTGATVTPVVSPTATALAHTPAVDDQPVSIVSAPSAGATLDTPDLNETAVFFGYYSLRELVGRVGREYPGLTPEQVAEVVVGLTRDRWMKREHDEHCALHTMLPIAVGRVRAIVLGF